MLSNIVKKINFIELLKAACSGKAASGIKYVFVLN